MLIHHCVLLIQTYALIVVMCLPLRLMKRNIRLMICLLMVGGFFTCGQVYAQQNNLLLRLVSTVGKLPLQPGDTCKNQFGETFVVNNFRYYISHIQLAGSDERFYNAGTAETLLVDFRDSASGSVSLNARPGVKYLRFLLGVDSIKNVSGVLTGVLDPARGMFWTWNSGYIMAKLEGRSEASTAPGRYFTYHIGGYRPEQQTARWITLPVNVTPGQPLALAADILQWFGGAAAITIATHPVCHEPGALAVAIADNYAHMFTQINEPVTP